MFTRVIDTLVLNIYNYFSKGGFYMEMMKGKWKYAIVFVILIIYVLIALFASGKATFKRNYIIIGDSLIVYKDNDGFHKATSVSDDLLDKTFTVYGDGNRYENSKVQYVNNQWYFFDENYADLNISKFNMAFSGGDYKALNFSSRYYEDSDYGFLNTALNGFTFSNDCRNSLRVTQADFDGDGNLESIYTTTNFSLGGTSESYLSLIFMVKDGNVSVINKSSNKPFRVYSVLDLDNDGVYELVVNYGDIDLSDFNSRYQIYKLKDGNFVLSGEL